MFKKLKAKIANREINKTLKGAKVTAEGERMLAYLKNIQNGKANYHIQDFDDFIDGLVEDTGEPKEVVVAAMIAICETIKENNK